MILKTRGRAALMTALLITGLSVSAAVPLAA